MRGLFGMCRARTVADRQEVDPREQIDAIPYAVLDTELTGLNVNRDSIVSIGAVRMSGGRIELGRSLFRVVMPGTALSSESVLVHGITPSEVADKPSIASVLGELREFCSDCVLVGHFISLDLAFLNREFRRADERVLGNPAVDTWRIHTWLQYQTDTAVRDFGENGDRDLFSLARKYQIPVAKAHDALSDAFITAQLFQRFLRALPDLGVRTAKDLLRIGRP